MFNPLSPASTIRFGMDQAQQIKIQQIVNSAPPKATKKKTTKQLSRKIEKLFQQSQRKSYIESLQKSSTPLQISGLYIDTEITNPQFEWIETALVNSLKAAKKELDPTRLVVSVIERLNTGRLENVPLPERVFKPLSELYQTYLKSVSTPKKATKQTPDADLSNRANKIQKIIDEREGNTELF